jgi:hypothetical protein
MAPTCSGAVIALEPQRCGNNACGASDVLDNRLRGVGEGHRPSQALKESQQDQEAKLRRRPVRCSTAKYQFVGCWHEGGGQIVGRQDALEARVGSVL